MGKKEEKERKKKAEKDDEDDSSEHNEGTPSETGTEENVVALPKKATRNKLKPVSVVDSSPEPEFTNAKSP